MTRYKGRTSAKTIEREGNHDGRHDRQHVCDRKATVAPRISCAVAFARAAHSEPPSGIHVLCSSGYPRTLLLKKNSLPRFRSFQ
jgi:hypothetical protein